MKRSEMIDLVYNKINEAWGYDNDLSKSNLSFILHLFECKGMLPPKYLSAKITENNVSMVVENVDIWNKSVTLGPIYEQIELNEWEKE